MKQLSKTILLLLALGGAVCNIALSQSAAPAHQQVLHSPLSSPALQGTLLKNFNATITDYLKVQKKAKGSLPAVKSTKASEELFEHQHQLADAIRSGRANAKQGDIFNPAVADLFRASIARSFHSAGPKIKTSLKHAEPVQDVPMQVNSGYPENVPLQSTPPSLLFSLPRLPKGLEYRIVGSNLVLRDTEANLIVDYIINALPQI